jgi:hypothetical protein
MTEDEEIYQKAKEMSGSTAMNIIFLEEQQTTSTHSGGQQTNESTSSDSPDTPHRGDTQIKGIATDTSESPLNISASPSPELRETLFFFQINNRTQATPFTPEDPEKTGRGFPIEGSGQIDSIVVVAKSNTFNVTLETDGDKIVDNQSWSQLDVLSSDLAHIGAYQRTSGEYVVSLSDYPFNEIVDFSIRPTQQTTFDTIRVEVILDQYTTGAK